jgi:predicted ATPase
LRGLADRSWSTRTPGGWSGSSWSRGCAACPAKRALAPWQEPRRWRRLSWRPTAAAPPADADPSFGVLHGLYWLVAALAAQRPQLLVVDDLHWADSASIRFFEFLANRIDAVPVLLLVARRPDAASAGGVLLGAPSGTFIELPPLSPEAAAAVVGEHSDAPVCAAFARACHSATGGNPLLLHRLALGLRERGIGGGREGDAMAVTRLGPYAVADVVGATLARLGREPACLAHAVAVLERAPLATAARLAGVDSGHASALAEQLVGSGILRDVRPLEFQHELVRDAVLSGLTAGERARLHADAARALAMRELLLRRSPCTCCTPSPVATRRSRACWPERAGTPSPPGA